MIVKAAGCLDRIIGKIHLADIHGSCQKFFNIVNTIVTKIEVLE